MTLLVIGCVIGASVGVIVMGLLAGRAMDDMERKYRRNAHSCGPRCTPLAGLHRSSWE